MCFLFKQNFYINIKDKSDAFEYKKSLVVKLRHDLYI